MKQTTTRMAQERWTPLERRLAERIRHKPLGECLTFEEFMTLARQGRRAKEYHQHMQHLVSCPACRRAYTELRALLDLQRFSLARWLKNLRLPQLHQWALASGVAASVFALALWTFYPRSTNSNLMAAKPDAPPRTEVAQNTETQPLPKDEAEQQPPKETTPGQQGGPNTPSKERNGNTGQSDSNKKQQTGNSNQKGSGNTDHGGDQQQGSGNQGANGSGGNQQIAKGGNENNNRHNPPGTNESLGENLSHIERDLASVGSLTRMGVEAIRNALGTLTTRTRSAPKTPTFGQLKLRSPRLNESEPVEEGNPPQFLLEDRTPAFAWAPVEGATKYRVTLRIPRTGEQVDVQELAPEQTEYRVAQSLDPDKTYELTIEAIREGARTLRGTLRFTVMTEAQQHDLKVARQKMKEAPVASSGVFYVLQRYREALEALELAQRRDPENEEIRRAIEQLRALLNR